MTNPSFSIQTPLLLLFIVPLVFSPNGEFVRVAEGSKRRIHITDDLDDIVDDEEDEAWKEWGKTKLPEGFDPPLADLDKMELSEIQEQFMKRHVGPLLGFVKLRLGVRRTPDMVADIATKWSKVMRTGAVGVKFIAVDMSTLMFNMNKGQDMDELKEFILSQPEAYEIKIGEKAFRRPGDPPLEEVIETLQREKEKADDAASKKGDEHAKEEL